MLIIKHSHAFTAVFTEYKEINYRILTDHTVWQWLMNSFYDKACMDLHVDYLIFKKSSTDLVLTSPCPCCMYRHMILLLNAKVTFTHLFVFFCSLRLG